MEQLQCAAAGAPDWRAYWTDKLRIKILHEQIIKKESAIDFHLNQETGYPDLKKYIDFLKWLVTQEDFARGFVFYVSSESVMWWTRIPPHVEVTWDVNSTAVSRIIIDGKAD